MRFFCLALTFGLLFVSRLLSAAAEDSWRKPLTNRNQFPLALLFISPDPERATVLEKGKRTLFMDFDYTNNLLLQDYPEESLVLDMEYLSSTFQFAAGIGKGFEIGASIPFYIMYGGFLDGFISGYHEAFGFPNNARRTTPNDRFRYEYLGGGQPLLERRDSVQAIGDLTLRVKKILTHRSKNEIAFRVAFKAPTGSPDKLSGSGAADFAFGLAASRVSRRFGGYFNLDYLVLGKPEMLVSKNTVSLMGAFEYRFKTNLAMLIQYQQLEPFIQSSLPALDQSAIQLTLGLRWRRSDRYHFEWRFAEDITRAAPDFTFGFSVAIHWTGGDKSQEQ
jgi:hypothetical protein